MVASVFCCSAECFPAGDSQGRAAHKTRLPSTPGAQNPRLSSVKCRIVQPSGWVGANQMTRYWLATEHCHRADKFKRQFFSHHLFPALSNVEAEHRIAPPDICRNFAVYRFNCILHFSHICFDVLPTTWRPSVSVLEATQALAKFPLVSSIRFRRN